MTQYSITYTHTFTSYINTKTSCGDLRIFILSRRLVTLKAEANVADMLNNAVPNKVFFHHSSPIPFGWTNIYLKCFSVKDREEEGENNDSMDQ